MEKLYELFAKVVAGTALIIVVLLFAALITAFPVKWAWNYAVPGIFHLKEIGYWEAFCLVWLAGSFIKAGPPRSDSK
jgi:hypothetical protein